MRGVKKTCEGGREGGAQSSFLEMSSAADLALSWREGRRRMGAELRVKGMVADGSTSVSSTRRQQSAQPLHRDYFALCFPAAQELGQCVLQYSILFLAFFIRFPTHSERDRDIQRQSVDWPIIADRGWVASFAHYPDHPCSRG